MRAVSVGFARCWPRITPGIEVIGESTLGVFLGEWGPGEQWRQFVAVDRHNPPRVAKWRERYFVHRAKVTPFMPERRDPARPHRTLFDLVADHGPGLLVRINTWSPYGPPGDWPDIDAARPMPCGYGAYDEAGTQTYKVGLVEFHDGDELAVTVAQEVHVLRLERGRLDVTRRSK